MGKLTDFLTAAANVLHTVTGNLKENKFTSAIIVAGGSSLRMGGETTKQMTLLCGIPVVVHTLLAFEKCERINEIIVVAKEDELPLYDGFKHTYGLSKLASVVKGGSTRQESSLMGFDATSPKADYVAIHDAARCLITSEEIVKTLDGAIKYGAASASVGVVDTVKIVDEHGFAYKTEDRNHVRLAQTPQIFSRNLYCAAAYTAKEEGFDATDDNMLVERIGRKIKMIDCSKDNIKITRPEDLKKAERILCERQKEVSK